MSKITNNCPSYHAHVYFDEQSLGLATKLCEQAAEQGMNVGKMHQKLVGPHPAWSCRLGFDNSQFEQVIPWLEQNRGELTVLIHGITGDDLKDHTIYTAWMGEALTLDLSKFG